jgi:hypothetical protein
MFLRNVGVISHKMVLFKIEVSLFNGLNTNIKRNKMNVPTDPTTITQAKRNALEVYGRFPRPARLGCVRTANVSDIWTRMETFHLGTSCLKHHGYVGANEAWRRRTGESKASGNTGNWTVSFTLQPLCPRGKRPRQPIDIRLWTNVGADMYIMANRLTTAPIRNRIPVVQPSQPIH